MQNNTTLFLSNFIPNYTETFRGIYQTRYTFIRVHIKNTDIFRELLPSNTTILHTFFRVHNTINFMEGTVK